MISYFVSGSDSYTVRTKQLCNTDALTWRLVNDYLLTPFTASIDTFTYNERERLLQFTASFPGGTNTGDQFTAEILDSGSVVWNGSVQVFKQQDWVKSQYNQQINNEFVSHVSDNEYIIID